jgi:hypothetical protein
MHREICHYASSDKVITSLFNKVYTTTEAGESVIRLPCHGGQNILGAFRLIRRALRLDKCNVVSIGKGYVAIRQGKVYYIKQGQETSPHCVLHLKNCRNVLHQSIAIAGKHELFFGEYGSNVDRNTVPVYRSLDGGEHWEIIYTFLSHTIKHVHGCYYDPFEEKIWVFTGDFESECRILCTDRNFEHIEWIGNGSQMYRACNAFFEHDSVHWIMDSQLQESFHIKMDRKTRTIKKKQLFPGPVWYIKKLSDGYYLAATAQEIGPGVKDRFAHLMVSKDLNMWEDVHRFRHDGLPKRYFKFGVIGFPDGIQDSRSVYMFTEAIKGLDGKVVVGEIG